jgi:hypothetical protein
LDRDAKTLRQAVKSNRVICWNYFLYHSLLGNTKCSYTILLPKSPDGKLLYEHEQNRQKTILSDWCVWDDDYNQIVQQIRLKLLQLALASDRYKKVLMQGSGEIGHVLDQQKKIEKSAVAVKSILIFTLYVKIPTMDVTFSISICKPIKTPAGSKDGSQR